MAKKKKKYRNAELLQGKAIITCRKETLKGAELHLI
jgi:hypothetical protein